MSDTSQRHIVAAELQAQALAAQLAAMRTEAEAYPGESLATQSRRYRKAKRLRERAEALENVASLARAFADAKPDDVFTLTIHPPKEEA